MIARGPRSSMMRPSSGRARIATAPVTLKINPIVSSLPPSLFRKPDR